MATRKKVRSSKGRAKIQKTMREFRTGKLRSGSKRGPKVTSRRQAIAIALNQASREGSRGKKRRKSRNRARA